MRTCYEGCTMKRLALLLLGALTLASFSATRVAAQTTGTGTTSMAFDPNFDVEIDGEPVERGQFAYVRAAQCSPDVEFKFLVQNYLTQVTVLEAWVSSTVDCNQAANRATVNNNPPGCWRIGDPLNQVMGKAELVAKANEIFRNGSTDEEGCPEQAGTKYTVYFVPLDAETSSNPASPPEATANQKLKGTFTLYTQLPAGPTGLSGQSGESQVGVKWSRAAGATMTTSYRAYFDTAIGDDSSCANSVLVAGAPAPEADGSSLFSSGLTKGLSTKLSGLDSKGVAIGSYVAAAVVSTDITEQEGVLSEVVCIERVQTDGFLDACERDPNCRGQFDTCSLRQGKTQRGAAALAVLLGLAIGFALRRRHV